MKSAKIENLESALHYLDGLLNFERLPEMSTERMGLEPIRALLARLDNPEKGLRVLHVAGSKGKGSTCLFAEGALGDAGIATGTFTSPHLHSWIERFRVSGREAGAEALTRAIAHLQPHVDWLRKNDPANAPTFFDATTAAALWIFADAGLKHAILEVGLGGRLDSTNAVESAVTCVTSIELEHTDKLGNTLAAIAGEKAGILKPKVPCLIGDLPEEAEQVVRRRAAELEVPVKKVGVDFERLGPKDIGVLGRHQLDNASIALCGSRLIARHEGAAGDADFEMRARRGIAQTRLPGRIEILAQEPRTIVDGAHTRASALSLASVLPDRVEGTSRLLLSISAGKDQAAILEILIPRFDRVTVTCAEPDRSLSTAELGTLIEARWPTLDLTLQTDPIAAAQAVQAETRSGDLLVAAGSIYMAGIARGIWLANLGNLH
jgi:dihydrofolate synthase/folylpolyglutamate synthase